MRESKEYYVLLLLQSLVTREKKTTWFGVFIQQDTVIEKYISAYVLSELKRHHDRVSFQTFPIKNRNEGKNGANVDRKKTNGRSWYLTPVDYHVL